MRRIAYFFMVLMVFESSASVPETARTFDFNIITNSLPRLKEEKILNSIIILKKIFSSPEFKDRILNHEYLSEKKFYFNKGLSNGQIYKKILSGMEELYPWKNNTMDVEIEFYTDLESNVIGYTRSDTMKVWMNNKYFNKHTLAELASNLTHEWLHKLGFDHEKERTDDRKYSVPYAIGYIVRELAKEHEEQSEVVGN